MFKDIQTIISVRREKNSAPVVNEAVILSPWRWLTAAAANLLCGIFMACAFPPLNWSVLAYIALVWPIYYCMNGGIKRAIATGFLFGIGWAFPSFYWLREIQGGLPYLMAPILSLYVICFFVIIRPAFRYLLIPVDIQLRGCDIERNFYRPQIFREILFAATVAAAYTVTEHWRCNVLPWNDLSVSQWKNIALIQIVSITGQNALTFLLVFMNTAIALAIRNSLLTDSRSRYRRPWAFIAALLLFMGCAVYGAMQLLNAAKQPAEDFTILKLGLVQCDISQRRSATDAEAVEALNICMQLSDDLLSREKVDLLVWPETAVPLPFRVNQLLCIQYRMAVMKMLEKYKTPFLFGTIDYGPPTTPEEEYATYNSAFLLTPEGKLAGYFYKTHPVPFGEYVPFRKYLPKWVIDIIDMNRDLTPGTSFNPLQIAPGIKAGISICFEDIFAYISRAEAQLGANLLLVITNDAWYPTSAEPEQHLANSIFRAVETNLPLVRCGNNSASCVIDGTGRIRDGVLRTITDDGKTLVDAVSRGRAAESVIVEIPKNPEMTFFTRHGNLFIRGCYLLLIVVSLYLVNRYLAKRRKLLALVQQDVKSIESKRSETP